MQQCATTVIQEKNFETFLAMGGPYILVHIGNLGATWKQHGDKLGQGNMGQGILGVGELGVLAT
jgi:hypothetical protein